MAYRLALLLSLALLPATSIAQSKTFVVPKGQDKVVDGNMDPWLTLGVYPTRLQNLYDTSHVPVTSAQIRGLAFRYNTCQSVSSQPSTCTLTVVMSVGRTPAGQPLPIFTANHGSKTTVFSGQVNWPGVRYATGVPAPFHLTVPFTTPFRYASSQGRSLVIDITMTAGNLQVSPFLDGVNQHGGWTCDNGGRQPNCGNGRSTAGRGYRQLSGNPLTNSGGSFSIGYATVWGQSPGAMTLSAFGLRRPGGALRLPFDLGVFGMHGCVWNVGVDSGFWLPMVSDSQGWAWTPPLRIQPGWGGLEFFDQAIFADKLAKGGFVVTTSRAWHVGRVVPADIGQLVAQGAVAPFVNPASATVIQLSY